MCIGLIFIADGVMAGLPKEWRPRPLGDRTDVMQRLQHLTGSRFDGCSLAVETPEGVLELSLDPADPVECVSVRALLSPDMLAVLRRICDSFGARFYDAEEGNFII